MRSDTPTPRPRIHIDGSLATYRVDPDAAVPMFGGVADLPDVVRVVSSSTLCALARTAGRGPWSPFPGVSASLVRRGDADTLVVSGDANALRLSAIALATAVGSQCPRLGVEASVMHPGGGHSRKSYALPVATVGLDEDRLVWAMRLASEHPTGEDEWKGDLMAAASLVEAQGGALLRTLFLLLASVRAHRVDARMGAWVWRAIDGAGAFPI